MRTMGLLPAAAVADMIGHAREVGRPGAPAAIVVRNEQEAGQIAGALAAAGVAAVVRTGKPDWRTPPAPWRPEADQDRKTG